MRPVTDHVPERIKYRAGAVLCTVGAGVLILCWLNWAGLLAPFLSRMVNRSVIVLMLLSLAVLIAGGRLLWESAHPRTRWRARRPGARFHSLVFYTRRDCGLCACARDLLLRYRRYLPPMVEVDIDDDPQLRSKFDTCVPVVELDGKVRFRGRVSEPLLRRLIDGAEPVHNKRQLTTR